MAKSMSSRTDHTDFYTSSTTQLCDTGELETFLCLGFLLGCSRIRLISVKGLEQFLAQCGTQASQFIAVIILLGF